MTDQACLAEVVRLTYKTAIQEAAVRKLTDQNVLSTIVIDASYAGSTALAALERLDNQSSLAKVAREAKLESLRLAAALKLTDQPILADLATAGAAPAVRSAAVKKLINQRLLANVAMRSSDSKIRRTALNKLTDQDLKGLVPGAAPDDMRGYLLSVLLARACIGMAPRWTLDVDLKTRTSADPSSGIIADHYDAHIVHKQSPTFASSMSLFREMLASGADPSVVRIAGYSKATEDPLTKVTRSVTAQVTVSSPIVNGGDLGEVILADEQGMTLSEYLAANGLTEARSLLDSHVRANK